uniref:Uncharacterized protein n=1 Tax=Tremella fuciformis TaxID=64657 RepID=D5KXZ1_9TREE|nr:unknown [Tremella fuciformis]
MPLIVIQWILAYFYMVETKGYTLEEIAMVFDGSSTADLIPSLESGVTHYNTKGNEREEEGTK